MALYVYIRCQLDQLDRHVDSEFHGVTVCLACHFLSANLRIVENPFLTNNFRYPYELYV